MLTRRNVLIGAGALSLAPLLSQLSLAAAPGDNRLCCILLRGAVDGLDVCRPVGDKAYAALRPDAARDAGNIDLDGRFAMHPALAPLAPLYRNRQLAFVHAVATPYRERSHFEGQDMLEIGGADRSLNTGWLNRMLGLIPRAEAVDIGIGESLILSGKAPVKSWYPETNVDLQMDSLQFLEGLYADDPLLSQALAGIEAEKNRGMDGEDADRTVSVPEVAALAGRFLAREARIAAFSINGWDTHRQQPTRMKRLLTDLSQAVLALKDALGPAWNKTVVVMMSEFGRTARLNGTDGTDHGTGGLAILAGGLLANGNGGRVLGDWPGLASLYEDRDLLPTSDVRLYAGSAAAELFGIDRSKIASVVFPGLDMSNAVKLL